LLEAASPLILLFIQLKNTEKIIDVNHLRKNIVNEINTFTNEAKAAHCSHQLILAAQYCLCTALDEVILLTPWGPQSGWAQQSLLSLLHRETWGGERFFMILEKMAEETKKNLPLLELLYLLLSLGFEGKYYNEEKMRRSELQYRLYRLIINYYPDVNINLSPSENIFKTKPKKYFLKFFSGVLGALLSMGLIFNTLLYWKAKPFLQALTDINISHSAFVAPQLSGKKKISAHIKYHYPRHHRFQREYHESLVLPPPAWGNPS
jgi:type IV/VI secretion system ImpK/VasF family protein